MKKPKKIVTFISEHKKGTVVVSALAATAVALTAYWWLKKNKQAEQGPFVEQVAKDVLQRRDDSYSLPVDGTELVELVGFKEVVESAHELEQALTEHPELDVTNAEGTTLRQVLGYLKDFARTMKALML